MTKSVQSGDQAPRSLAEALSAAGYSQDLVTSSEDEAINGHQDFPDTDVQSIVGISLGPAQSRLLSPEIPAGEKSAAIEEAGGFFTTGDGLLDGVVEEPDELDPTLHESAHHSQATERDEDERQSRAQHDHASPNRARLPSPWRSGPQVFQRTDESRSLLRDGFLGGRKRSSSGPQSLSTLDGWQKAFFSGVSGFPKHFSISSALMGRRSSSATRTSTAEPMPDMEKPRGGLTDNRPDDANTVSPARRSDTLTGQSPKRLQDHAILREQSDLRRSISRDDSAIPDLRRPPPLQTRSSYLRRSASDHSLQLHSALSRVPSLGDDTRFENVSDQVNSRLKAIKDSWQDSTIRLPSLPSMSNLSLDAFKPDFNFTFPGRNAPARPTTSGETERSWADGETARATFSPTPSETRREVKATGNIKDGGPGTKAALSHPHFTKACADTIGDLVVLGGYRGSILRSAEPPHRQLWVPVKVGLNIRKVDLEVGLSLEDEENMETKIIPGGMLTHIGPVDISRRLFRRLRACDNARSGRLRVHDYGYDWRLDPLLLSQKLIKYLEKLPCNRPGVPKDQRGATIIAHSLGGMITRHAINQRPDLISGIVYAGTPTTCVNILGPLRNGDDVLLSSRVLTAQVNFTIRTSFALLPLDGKCFFNKDTKEQFPVDFFDVNNWIEYRLSPCVARPLPPLTIPQNGGIMSSLSNAMPNLPGKRGSVSFFESARNVVTNPKERTISSVAKTDPSDTRGSESTQSAAQDTTDAANNNTSGTTLARGSGNGRTDLEPSGMDHSSLNSSVATTVTIPRDVAIAYLTKTLARVKTFRQQLDFRPEHGARNLYPPAAVIYGKSTPTVYGAKVVDREAIKRADAYAELAFASGDGVVLARAAMLPEGYQVARGGTVSSDRGHVTLLGDLEAVGRALNAVNAARKKGVGRGRE